MRRRDVIALLSTVALTRPGDLVAQQAERTARVGVLVGLAEDDPETRARVAAIRQSFEELGWSDRRNLRLDWRYGGGDTDRIRSDAVALVRSSPAVILATTTLSLSAARQATEAFPIVFVNVGDPLGQGFVASLATPGGNITGFTNTELPIYGKQLELLKEVSPGLRRVLVIA
jgi:putative tryptophan/tyrosine transport system substrate-binding protein